MNTLHRASSPRAFFGRAVIAAASLFGFAMAPFAANAEPKLQRFVGATVSVPDLATSERDYRDGLGYLTRERGRVTQSLAQSWGAPRAAGRRFVLLSPDAAPDVYVRLIEASPAPDFRALTTPGWNAIEIVVDDTDAIDLKLQGGPFKRIGGPANLTGYPSIRAVQVLGRAQEVIYLTSETGDRSRSVLPAPNGPIGRIFIMVIAGTDIEALTDWYARAFELKRNPIRPTPVGVVQRAQNLGPDATIPLTTLSLAQPGNLLELDGYPSTVSPRKVRTGELPPGIAITSFEVQSLDGLPVQYLAPPRVQRGRAYGDRRAATVRGPAGELIELVEK